MGGGASLRGFISNNVASSTRLKNVSIHIKDNKGRCTNWVSVKFLVLMVCQPKGEAIKSWGSRRVSLAVGEVLLDWKEGVLVKTDECRNLTKPTRTNLLKHGRRSH